MVERLRRASAPTYDRPLVGSYFVAREDLAYAEWMGFAGSAAAASERLTQILAECGPAELAQIDREIATGRAFI